MNTRNSASGSRCLFTIADNHSQKAVYGPQLTIELQALFSLVNREITDKCLLIFPVKQNSSIPHSKKLYSEFVICLIFNKEDFFKSF